MLGLYAEGAGGAVATLAVTVADGVRAGPFEAVARVGALAPELAVRAFAVAVAGHERA